MDADDFLNGYLAALSWSNARDGKLARRPATYGVWVRLRLIEQYTAGTALYMRIHSMKRVFRNKMGIILVLDVC